MSSQDSVNLPSRADYLQRLQQQQSSPTLQGECRICYEPTSDTLVSACGHDTHTFHHECLLTWFSQVDTLGEYQRTCPTCRRELYSRTRHVDSNRTAQDEELQQARDARNSRRMEEYRDLVLRQVGERSILVQGQTLDYRELRRRQGQALEESNQRQEVYESRIRYLDQRQGVYKSRLRYLNQQKEVYASRLRYLAQRQEVYESRLRYLDQRLEVYDQLREVYDQLEEVYDQRREVYDQWKEVHESTVRCLDERRQLIGQHVLECEELLQRQDQALEEFDRQSLSEIDSLYNIYYQDIDSLFQSYGRGV